MIPRGVDWATRKVLAWPLLPAFMDLYPELTLDLNLSDPQFDLIEGSYDLALRNAALEDSSLIARKLADDRRVLCASPAYLAAYGKPSTSSDLAKHWLIAFCIADIRAVRSILTFAMTGSRDKMGFRYGFS